MRNVDLERLAVYFVLGGVGSPRRTLLATSTFCGTAILRSKRTLVKRLINADIFGVAHPGIGCLMANTVKTNVEDLVSAIRQVAKELGCNESEERFQEVLFTIGRHKPVRPNASSKRIDRRKAGTSSAS
jgi:hypothetical protein